MSTTVNQGAMIDLRNNYRDSLRLQDMSKPSNTIALNPNQYIVVASYKVEADEYVGLGYGFNVAQNTAQGRIFAHFKEQTSGDSIDGKLRIEITTSQKKPLSTKPIVIDIALETLRSGEGNREGQIPYAWDEVFYSEDRIINLQILADEAVTVDMSASKFILDITRNLV